MALENFFQVSTMYSTRVALPQSSHPFSSLEKLPSPISTRFSKPNLSFGSIAHSFNSKSLKSRIVCKAREVVDEVQVVNDSSWESLVMGSDKPVLVDFWAPWCGPCRMIAPVIDELAKEYAGKIYCFKVNTDDCPNIANKYGIRSIPTVLFFKNGEKKESVIGAVPKSTLSATVEKYLEL